MTSLLLCCDTSTHVGSLALSHFNETSTLIDEIVWDKKHSHSELITDQLTVLLKRNHVSLKEIQELGCGVGPGSFTGIRVSLNFIKALAYSLELPVFNFNSLQILAAGVPTPASRIVTSLYGFQNLCYTAVYKKDSANKIVEIQKPQALREEQLLEYLKEPCLFVGTAYDFLQRTHKEFSNEAFAFSRNSTVSDIPLASHLSQLVSQEKSQTKPVPWKNILPLYIRDSEAQVKLKLSDEHKS